MIMSEHISSVVHGYSELELLERGSYDMDAQYFMHLFNEVIL